jgi:hypothetical protein
LTYDHCAFCDKIGLTKGFAIDNARFRCIANAIVASTMFRELPAPDLVRRVGKGASSFMSAAVKPRASMEAGDRRRGAGQYRERARSLRELALRTNFPEVRGALMALALQHERLAAYIETRSADVSEARADAAD